MTLRTLPTTSDLLRQLCLPSVLKYLSNSFIFILTTVVYFSHFMICYDELYKYFTLVPFDERVKAEDFPPFSFFPSQPLGFIMEKAHAALIWLSECVNHLGSYFSFSMIWWKVFYVWVSGIFIEYKSYYIDFNSLNCYGLIIKCFVLSRILWEKHKQKKYLYRKFKEISPILKEINGSTSQQVRSFAGNNCIVSQHSEMVQSVLFMSLIFIGTNIFVIKMF